MKKLLLILLCLPFIGFGQFQYKLDSIVQTANSSGYSETIIYNYDNQGRNIGMLRVFDNIEDYTDSAGNIIYSFSGIYHSTTYDSQSNPINFTAYLINAATQNLDTHSIRSFIHNSNNLCIEQEIITIQTAWGSQASTLLSTYSYNTSNQLILSENILNGQIVSKTDSHWQSGVIDYSIHSVWNLNNSTWDSVGISQFNFNGGNLINTNWNNNSTDYNYNTVLMSNTAFPIFINFEWALYGISAYTNQITVQQHYTNGALTTTDIFYYSPFQSSSIYENIETKHIVTIIDLLGRETKGTNQPLFYIYNDGTVEKRIVIE